MESTLSVISLRHQTPWHPWLVSAICSEGSVCGTSFWPVHDPPSVFTKVLAPLLGLRTRGIPVMGYLDNLLLREKLPQNLTF